MVGRRGHSISRSRLGLWRGCVSRGGAERRRTHRSHGAAVRVAWRAARRNECGISARRRASRIRNGRSRGIPRGHLDGRSPSTSAGGRSRSRSLGERWLVPSSRGTTVRCSVRHALASGLAQHDLAADRNGYRHHGPSPGDRRFRVRSVADRRTRARRRVLDAGPNHRAVDIRRRDHVRLPACLAGCGVFIRSRRSQPRHLGRTIVVEQPYVGGVDAMAVVVI
jgi:hypothetical protein